MHPGATARLTIRLPFVYSLENDGSTPPSFHQRKWPSGESALISAKHAIDILLWCARTTLCTVAEADASIYCVLAALRAKRDDQVAAMRHLVTHVRSNKGTEIPLTALESLKDDCARVDLTKLSSTEFNAAVSRWRKAPVQLPQFVDVLCWREIGRTSRFEETDRNREFSAKIFSQVLRSIDNVYRLPSTPPTSPKRKKTAATATSTIASKHHRTTELAADLLETLESYIEKDHNDRSYYLTAADGMAIPDMAGILALAAIIGHPALPVTDGVIAFARECNAVPPQSLTMPTPSPIRFRHYEVAAIAAIRHTRIIPTMKDWIAMMLDWITRGQLETKNAGFDLDYEFEAREATDSQPDAATEAAQLDGIASFVSECLLYSLPSGKLTLPRPLYKDYSHER